MVGQDSTKVLSHEIGFNTVSLIKQMISNNPSSVLPQLPYSVFYNLYYKNKIGLRLGMGIITSKTETEITNQVMPRTTNQVNLDLRAGVSYNFVTQQRLTLNAFVDYVCVRYKSETANTSTVQSFPNPITIISTETTDKTIGNGAQIGVGVKYNLYKHLSLYAELPVTFLSQKISSEVSVNDTGTLDISTTSTKSSGIKVFVPTTVYLVLRF
jgi:hypothetical protein